MNASLFTVSSTTSLVILYLRYFSARSNRTRNLQKVENAQLEHELRASGVRLPRDTKLEPESIPEEPLPEYLAALWDFAEGKPHSSKLSPTIVTPRAAPAPIAYAQANTPSPRHSRRTSSTSSPPPSTPTLSSSPSSTSSSSISTNTYTNAKKTRINKRALTSPSSQLPPVGATQGQALEDASALCAFMEAAQTRAAKRSRTRPTRQEGGDGFVGIGNGNGLFHRNTRDESQQQQQQHPRVWSDHGSTTSESRGSMGSDDEAANERKSSARSSGASGRDPEAMFSPACWSSRQVLERYVLPRQVC